MGKREKTTPPVVSKEIKEKIISTICNELNIYKKDYKKFFKRAFFKSSPNGGVIKVFAKEEHKSFSFILNKVSTENGNSYNLVETNARVFNHVLYRPWELPDPGIDLSSAFTQLFYDSVESFCNNVGYWSKEDFLIEDITYLNNCYVSATIRFKNNFFEPCILKQVNVADLYNGIGKFPPLKFKIDADFFIDTIKKQKCLDLVCNNIISRCHRRDSVIFDFNNNSYFIKNPIIFKLSILNANNIKGLEDFYTKNETDLILRSNNLLKKLSNRLIAEESLHINCSLKAINPNNGDLLYGILVTNVDDEVAALNYTFGFYINRDDLKDLDHMYINKHYNSLKEAVKEHLKQINEKVICRKKEQLMYSQLKKEFAVKLAGAYQEYPINKYALLTKYILKTINQSYGVSKRDIIFSLKEEKCYGYDFGYFKNFENSEICKVLDKLVELNIITVCNSHYKDNKNNKMYMLKNDLHFNDGSLENIFLVANIKDDWRAEVYKKCKNLERFNESSIEILSQIFTDSCLLMCLENDLKNLIRKSSPDITEYIRTVIEIETDTEIKKLLEKLVSEINCCDTIDLQEDKVNNGPISCWLCNIKC